MTTVKMTAAQALFRYLAAQTTERSEPILSGIWTTKGVEPCVVDALACGGCNIVVQNGKSILATALIASAFDQHCIARQTTAVWGAIESETEFTEAITLACDLGLPVLFVLGCGEEISDWEFTGCCSASSDCCEITNPNELLEHMPHVIASLTDPRTAGPVKLMLAPTLRTEIADWPTAFFERKVWPNQRRDPNDELVVRAAEALARSEAPIIVAGNGVQSGEVCSLLRELAEDLQIPVVETRGGRSALAWDHPLNFGPVGDSGSETARKVFEAADVVLWVGATPSEQRLLISPATHVCLGASSYNSDTEGALPLIGDPGDGVKALAKALKGRRFALPDPRIRSKWFEAVAPLVSAPAHENQLPNECQVIGAIQRSSDNNTTVLSAGGPLADNLHRLWKAARPGVCKLCFGEIPTGYEIPLAIGTKMAEPDSDVICLMQADVYQTMNEELATAIDNNVKITVVITSRPSGAPTDVADDARSMGAISVHARSIAELEAALSQARVASRAFVIVIDTVETVTSETEALAAGAQAETHRPHGEAVPHQRP